MAPPPGGVRTPLSFTGPLSGPVAGAFSAQASWMTPGAVFSPGTSLQPITPDQQPRFWDFPVNINSRITPRIGEAFSFRELRAFANVELVRMAIETRKDQFERLDWQIKPMEEKKARALKNGSVDTRITTLTKFWRKPDQVTPFATWMRELLEDLLVLDAPTLCCLRTRGGGGPGGAGKLLGLEVIPGDTIEPKVDDTGRRPRLPSDVAYQQIIKGVAWVDLANSDIIYAPRNVRPNHHYGFSPCEQIIVTINTVINRQARQLAYFTEGNLPAGFLTGPEGWNPDQIRAMQEWLDSAVTGQLGEQMRLRFMPGGTKYQAFKDAPLKDEFDEWLARMVAYAFSLPPTPFIKQMNRSTGETDADRAQEEGLEPLKLWAKRLIDGVIQDDFGYDDLEFAWVDTPSIDPKIQAEIDNVNLRNGSATIDEVRDGRGDDPLPDGQGAQPLLYTSTGAMTLEQVLRAAETELNPVETPTPVATNQAPRPGQAEPDSPAAEAAPPPAKGAPKADAGKPANDHAGKASVIADLFKAASPIRAERPKGRRLAASLKQALVTILQKAGDHVAGEVGRKLRGLFKADTPDAAWAALAAKLAAEADLSELDAISDAAYDDLFEMAFDSSKLAIASIGNKAEGDLFDQVHQRAVDYAKQRSAELVSLQGDKNIVEATRNQIRDVIAKGLADNIGSDAIAEAVQESAAFSAARAELIARMEISMANAAGKKAGWDTGKEAGLVMVKYWQTSNDDGVDEECEQNEAQGDIPYDDDFQSGDFMEPQHVNCRCTTVVTASLPDDGGDDSSEEGDEE